MISRPVRERVVDLPAKLAADGEVGGGGGDRDRDRDGDGDRDREAGAEAHGSRSA